MTTKMSTTWWWGTRWIWASCSSSSSSSSPSQPWQIQLTEIFPILRVFSHIQHRKVFLNKRTVHFFKWHIRFTTVHRKVLSDKYEIDISRSKFLKNSFFIRWFSSEVTCSMLISSHFSREPTHFTVLRIHLIWLQIRMLDPHLWKWIRIQAISLEFTDFFNKAEFSNFLSYF